MKTLDGLELIVNMPDGTRMGIPVQYIADNRALFYFKSGEFKSFAESLSKDTIPLFIEDDYAIEDWARNNMNWDDVKKHARRAGRWLEKNSDDMFQDGWLNGEMKIE